LARGARVGVPIEHPLIIGRAICGKPGTKWCRKKIRDPFTDSEYCAPAETAHGEPVQRRIRAKRADRARHRVQYQQYRRRPRTRQYDRPALPMPPS
jgi:hypothetical protein